MTSVNRTATSIRVGVLGAGAIGSFIGAILTQHENIKQVVLVGRKTLLQCCKEHDNKIALNSINHNQQKVIESFSGSLTVKVATSSADFGAERLIVTDNAQLLGDCDVIIVAVKSTHTEEASKALVGVKKRCLVYSFQNGVGNAAIIKKFTQANPNIEVVGAVVVFNVRWDRATNTFIRASNTEIILEIPSVSAPELMLVHQAFLFALKGTYFEVGEVSGSAIANHQYSKLMLNLTNAANTLCGRSIPETFEDPQWREVIVLMMKEANRIYSAANIKTVSVHRGNPAYFPYLLSVPEWLFNCLIKRMFPTNREAKTSMLQDMIAGVKTEVDFLNGAVVALAKQAGLEAKINERMTELVHAGEEKRGQGQDWTMDPKEVLRILQA